MGIGKGGGTTGGKSPPAPATPEPLWPMPLPVVGVTGAYGSGKTLFGMTISPRPGTTLVYDFEKSSESYAALGAHRVDAADHMLDKFQGKAKPIDLFKWWRSHMRSIQPGKYRVIMIDPVSELESGLVAYVEANPQEFGRTAAQYLKASGLKWGDVKEYWKSILSELASRCETFVFVAHLGSVWADNKPTGKMKAKGKTTLDELASLYLHMERTPDRKTGQAPAVPSAIVKKQRALHVKVDDSGVPVIDPQTGELVMVPALPPRLPVATPAAVRKYMLSPPDYDALAEDERAPEEAPPTEAEILEMRTRVAEAELETERLRADRAARSAAPRVRVTTTVEQADNEDGEPAGDAGGRSVPTPEGVDPDGPVTEPQLAVLSSLYGDVMGHLGDEAGKKAWSASLAKRGVKSARSLTAGAAAELIDSMQYHLSLWQAEESIPTDRAGLSPAGNEADGAGGAVGN